MADDDQCSSIRRTMVDGLTPVERRTTLSILMDQLVKDFSHHYYAPRRPLYGHIRDLFLLIPTTKEEEETAERNYAGTTLVHPRYVFHPSDEPLMTYISMDYLRYRSGGKIVPEMPTWLMPVIPIVLVNGGIGKKYNPWDVIAYFKQRLSKDKDKGKPVHIRLWTDGDDVLKKKTETCLGVVEERASSDRLVAVKDVEAFFDQMKKARARYHNNFKSTDTSNIVLLLDNQGRNRKYESIKEILDEFFDLRLESYEERKSAMLELIKGFVDQMGEEASKHGGEYFDDEKLILEYDLSDEVLYAEAQNHIFRSTGFQLLDFEHEDSRQSWEWWIEKPQMLDLLKEDVSKEDMWLNDLDAFQEQLNEQYKKQEPYEVRSSSLEEDASLVQDKDELKMGKKRIRESDSKSGEQNDEEDDEAETRKVLRAT